MKHRGTFAYLFCLTIQLVALCVLRASDGGSEDSIPPEMLKRFTAPKYTPKEIQPVLDAEAANKYDEAVRLATEIINTSAQQLGPESYGNWIQSLAHMHKGRDGQHLGGTFKAAFDEEMIAADLGNFQALQDVTKWMFDDYTGVGRIGDGYISNPQNLASHFKAAADLGDFYAEEMIGLGKVPGNFSDEERSYWLLLGLMRDFVIDPKKKVELFKAFIDKFGEDKLESVLSEYSLCGGTLKKSPLGLPGRGIEATLFVDGDIRGTFENLFGVSKSLPDEIPEAPSVKEQWDFYKRIAASLGYQSAYMIVSGTRKFDDRQIYSCSLENITSELQPDDRVFVRSGNLAHVAIIYKLDRKNDKIYFADGAPQYWEPRHNGFSNSYRSLEANYHRYLSVVSLSEIAPKIEAVIALRDPAK